MLCAHRVGRAGGEAIDPRRCWSEGRWSHWAAHVRDGRAKV